LENPDFRDIALDGLDASVLVAAAAIDEAFVWREATIELANR
jgi:hypothetical protein